MGQPLAKDRDLNFHLIVPQIISHLLFVIQQQLIFKASLGKCQNSKSKDNDEEFSVHVLKLPLYTLVEFKSENVHNYI